METKRRTRPHEKEPKRSRRWVTIDAVRSLMTVGALVQVDSDAGEAARVLPTVAIGSVSPMRGK